KLRRLIPSPSKPIERSFGERQEEYLERVPQHVRRFPPGDVANAGEAPSIDVHPVDPGRVPAGDLGLLLLGAAGQQLREDLPRLGESALEVRVVGAEGERVDADAGALLDGEGVLLEADEGVAAEVIAGEGVPRDSRHFEQ